MIGLLFHLVSFFVECDVRYVSRISVRNHICLLLSFLSFLFFFER